MARSSKPPTEDEMARAVDVARRFAGEDHGPLTTEEEGLIREVRDTQGRPSKKEIAALAKRLAQPR